MIKQYTPKKIFLELPLPTKMAISVYCLTKSINYEIQEKF